MELDKLSKGFTLVELVVTILVISIVAAIAIPRYISMNTQAYESSVKSVAAALNAASADNFAKRSANSVAGYGINNCSVFQSAFPTLLPSGYSINAAAIAAGASVTCTVVAPDGQTATFVGLGIS